MQSKMKKWELNNEISPLAPILEDELKIPPVFANILAQRGISNFEEAKQFFRPSFSDLLDPFSMLGMKKAVDRVIQAKQENQKVLVYGMTLFRFLYYYLFIPSLAASSSKTKATLPCAFRDSTVCIAVWNSVRANE